MDEINYSEEIENYQNQMTPSERIFNYMKGEEVDHLPFNILDFDPVMCNIMGYTTSQMNNDFDVRAKVIEERINRYDIRGISIGIRLRTLGAACGSKLYFPENGVDHIEEYIFEEDFDVDTLEIPDVKTNEILSEQFELAKKLRDRFPNETISTQVVGPISAATSFRSAEKLLKDSRKNLDKVVKLLDFCVEAQLKWVNDFVKEFGKGSIWISDPVSTNDLLSPKQFEKLSLPFLSKLVDGLDEITDVKPTLHICGHSKAIWGKIKNLNIGTFSVDNCEDIGECKEALGDKVLIMGNVPPTDIMLLDDSKAVVNSVKECIKKAGDSPNGYMVATGCGTPIGTPQKNIDAFIYAVRKFSVNARKGVIPEAVYL